MPRSIERRSRSVPGWLASCTTVSPRISGSPSFELAELANVPTSRSRPVEWSADVGAAIDIGLGEARQAVVALRSPTEGELSFCNLVRRTVEDDGDRFGLRVEFACDGDQEAHIEPRTQAEILRIVQEAMTNVARHAQATVVGVRLGIRGDRVTLRVVDNGRGFDVSRVADDAFGLASMRERAALIGGRLRIASRAGMGTGVVLSAPVDEAGCAGPRARAGSQVSPSLRVLTVMIVDDHPLVRSAVARAIEGTGHDRGRRGREQRGGAGLAPQLAPDILLLDIALPDGSGIQIVRELAPRLPATKIVMLTVSSADRDVADAMRYGAVGYLTKDVTPAALARAVRATQDGELVMPRRLAARLIARMSLRAPIGSPVEGQPVESLTPRERDVHRLLAEGMGDRDIAVRIDDLAPDRGDTRQQHPPQARCPEPDGGRPALSRRRLRLIPEHRLWGRPPGRRGSPRDPAPAAAAARAATRTAAISTRSARGSSTSISIPRASPTIRRRACGASMASRISSRL